MFKLRLLIFALAPLVACEQVPAPGPIRGDDPESEPIVRDEPEPEPEVPSGDMVSVAAGAFLMGCDTCQADEAPAHLVDLPTFEIDRTEVSQRSYAACVDADACDPPAENYDPESELPVVSLTFDQAMGYCAFRGARLPTEAEWEKAARGDDGRRFPWGDAAPDCDKANTSECEREVLPVGSLEAGASPYGALNMAGNVWEWVADFYAEDAYPLDAGRGPSEGDVRVYRGGSAGNLASLATTTNRASSYNPAVGGSGLGFRCAR